MPYNYEAVILNGYTKQTETVTFVANSLVHAANKQHHYVNRTLSIKELDKVEEPVEYFTLGDEEFVIYSDGEKFTLKFRGNPVLADEPVVIKEAASADELVAWAVREAQTR